MRKYKKVHPILAQAFKTRRYGLPFSGGWMEQPAGFVDYVSTALNYFDAGRMFVDSKDWVEFGKSNPEAMEIIGYCSKNIDKLND